MRCAARFIRRVAAAIHAVLLVVSPAESQQVRDSGGVRIVSYERNATAKHRWSLEAKPVLEIGGSADEGPSAFSEIVGAVRLSDGSIAVANRQPSEIRVFDNAGRFLRSLGRGGQGPCEFNRVLFRLLRSSDTLIGIDNSLRAQVFAPGGELLRSLPRARPPNVAGPMRLGFDERGRAIVQSVESPSNVSPARDTVRLLLWSESPDAEAYDSILRFFGYRPTGAQPPALPYEMYGARGNIATNGRRICAGVTSTFAIDCFGLDGRLLLSIRRFVRPRAVTADDRQFFGDAYLSANRNAPPAAIAAINEAIRLTRFAARVPAFGRMILAVDGSLWASALPPL